MKVTGGKLAVGLLALYVMWNVIAWGLMLLLGGLHHEVSSSIPAPSYLGSVLLLVCLQVGTEVVRASRK